MADTGTVAQIAFARWRVRLPAVIPRFAEPGWSYEEPVRRPCPNCTGQMHSLRKPYERNGRQGRYVALVCPACPASFALADLGLKTYDHVMKPTPPAPHAAAPGTPTTGPASSTARRQEPATAEAGRQRDIVQFWRAVELFDSQVLKHPNPRERRYKPEPGEALPWQQGHPLRRHRLDPDQTWRHTLYVGVFSLDRIHAVAKQVFGTSPVDVDERTPRGETALFGVVMTDDGRMLLDSLVLSTAAWAAGRAGFSAASSTSNPRTSW